MRKGLSRDFLRCGLGYHPLFSRWLDKFAEKSDARKREVNVAKGNHFKTREAENVVDMF